MKAYNFQEAKTNVVDGFEKSALIWLLTVNHGSVRRSAEMSMMLRQSFQRLLRKHKIKSATYRISPRPRLRGVPR